MATNFFEVRKGINLDNTQATAVSVKGDVAYNTNTDKVEVYNGAVDPIVTEAKAATLTNKSISGSTNTLSNIGNTSLTNSSVTIGSTNVALGATASTVAGLTLTSPILTTPALGTPASGVLTNTTGLPLTTGVTGVLPIANGGTNVNSVTTSPTATSFAGWDANKNLSANAFIPSTSVVATASGTTTLTVSSAQNQVFTGTLGQTIVLPAATTLAVGQTFSIYNQSSAALTMQFNGGTAFTDASGKAYSQLAPNTTLIVSVQTNGSSAGTWAVVATSGSSLGAPGPTVQKFTSGSGTYTLPANVSFIRVRMVGGGGGGGNGGTTAGTAATTGGQSYFGGTGLLIANGGVNGANDGTGGGGGTASLGTGTPQPIGTVLPGGAGGGSVSANGSTQTFASGGGAGGNSAFGGGGAGSPYSASGTAGGTNTGGGGGGGGNNFTAGSSSGSGGGAGGYVDAIIVSPNATYSYQVGAGGTGQTSGLPGANGGSGYIEVNEFYYNGLGASGGNGGVYTPTVSTVTATSANHGGNTVTGNFSAVGSGTYTTPANVSYIRVRMVGGGGGGGGSGATTGGTGGSAGNTTFGTSFLTANGGTGGSNAASGGPGTGGSATLAAGAVGTVLSGGGGCEAPNENSNLTYIPGGAGGVNPFGGNGTPALVNAQVNTGAGGAGGPAGATGVYCGCGGGSGGFLDVIINNPSATYAYSVGAGGAGGTAGTSGNAGGAGAGGYIEVTEYYQNGAVGTATSITGQITSSNVQSSAFTAPTFTRLGSGTSATYTTPTSPRAPVYLKVQIVGGGGGGSGSQTSGGSGVTNGGTGGTTTFGNHSCTGGTGGVWTSGGGAPGQGGTGTIGSGGVGFTMTGSWGTPGAFQNTGVQNMPGGSGGVGPFGGGSTAGNSGGNSPVTGSGSGGAGGQTGATTNITAGSGGGAGGYAEVIIANPAATYTYTVGSGGTNGALGTSGSVGLGGASGVILITEYYQ